MTLETQLKTVVSGVLDRFMPDEAPFDTPMPYGVWQQIGGDALTYIEGTLPDKENALVQIRVWAATRMEANSLARQVEAALVAATSFQAQPVSARVSEKEGDAYGNRQDFSIWVQRSP